LRARRGYVFGGLFVPHAGHDPDQAGRVGPLSAGCFPWRIMNLSACPATYVSQLQPLLRGAGAFQVVGRGRPYFVATTGAAPQAA